MVFIVFVKNVEIRKRRFNKWQVNYVQSAAK